MRLHRLTRADWDRIEQTLLARAGKSAILPLDNNGATIVSVAVQENHQTTQADNEPPQPTQTPQQAMQPQRASKLATLPRKGGGWIKRW